MSHLAIRHTSDSLLEVGIDEAGRGSLWGPLYAAAVIWSPESDQEILPLIKDSKKLTIKRRTAIAEKIKDAALDWGIGSVSSQEIDTIGVTKANQLAFVRALGNLVVHPERIIIDGILSIYDPPWSLTEQIVEPEADNKYIPVAAASILAKTEHDNWVKEFCETNENIASRYDLLSNKGYGTAKHRAGIIQWGEHSLHRKLFLRKLYSQNSVLEVKDS